MRTLCAWGALAWLALLGTTAQAQPTFDDSAPFEGAITWNFTVRGEMREHLRMVNPINTMTMHIRNGDYIIHLYANAQARADADAFAEPFPTTRLFIADSNRTYTIDVANSRAFSGDMYEKPDSVPPVAVFTGDSMLIQGHWCYAYRVIKPDDKITYYITPKIHVELGYYANATEATASFLTQGLRGCIPLLTIRENARRTIEIRAVSINPQRYEEAMFRIPRQFHVTKMRDYRR
jgi:hypothetical protein